MQSRPSSRVGVEGAQRDPGLDGRDRQRVGGQAAALEGTVVEAFEGELLDRGPGAVGVEPDLAEEDTVGPGDRPFAHVDRVGAVEAVGEVAQPARGPAPGCGRASRRPRPRRCRGRGTRRRRAAPPSPAAGPGSASPIGRSRCRSTSARLRRGGRRAAVRSTRASSCAAVSSPMLGALQRATGVDVGEGRAAADPVEAGDGAVAVVADRHPPAVLRGPGRARCRDRRGRPARESSPVHGSAGRPGRRRPAAGAVAAPLVNQNEITSGRSKKSQTRIAPAVAIRQAGSRRAPRGQGTATFRSRPGRRWRRLRARPAAAAPRTPAAASGRAGVEAEGAFAAVAASVWISGDDDHRRKTSANAIE